MKCVPLVIIPLCQALCQVPLSTLDWEYPVVGSRGWWGEYGGLDCLHQGLELELNSSVTEAHPGWMKALSCSLHRIRGQQGSCSSPPPFQARKSHHNSNKALNLCATVDSSSIMQNVHRVSFPSFYISWIFIVTPAQFWGHSDGCCSVFSPHPAAKNLGPALGTQQPGVQAAGGRGLLLKPVIHRQNKQMIGWGLSLSVKAFGLLWHGLRVSPLGLPGRLCGGLGSLRKGCTDPNQKVYLGLLHLWGLLLEWKTRKSGCE